MNNLGREPDELRQAFDGRPLLVVASGLIVGLTVPSHWVNVVFLAAGLSLLVRTGARLVLTIGFVTGLLLAPSVPPEQRERDYIHIEGSIVGLPRTTARGERFTLQTAERAWQVDWGQEAVLGMGDRVFVRGLALPLQEGSEEYLRLHGISGRIQASSVQVRSLGPSVWQWARSWREAFRTSVLRSMDPANADILEALCFDASEGLDPEVRERLKNVGAFHVVVASGFHVLLFASMGLWVLERVPIPRSMKIGMISAALVLYAGATGLATAVVRAGLMWILAHSAYFFRREPDGLSALGGAATLVLLWQPREVFQVGFLLSFVAVGGIVLFFQPQSRSTLGIRAAFTDTLRIAGMAFLATSPIMAYAFGQVSLAALPANLLIAPAASVAIGSALVAQGLGGALPAAASGILRSVTEPMIGWILWVCDRLSGAVVSMPAFSAYWLVLLYGLLLMTWRPRIVQP